MIPLDGSVLFQNISLNITMQSFKSARNLTKGGCFPIITDNTEFIQYTNVYTGPLNPIDNSFWWAQCYGLPTRELCWGSVGRVGCPGPRGLAEPRVCHCVWVGKCDSVTVKCFEYQQVNKSYINSGQACFEHTPPLSLVCFYLQIHPWRDSYVFIFSFKL